MQCCAPVQYIAPKPSVVFHLPGPELTWPYLLHQSIGPQVFDRFEDKNYTEEIRREMCAVTGTSAVNVLVERLNNAISQTLCPSEI